MIFQNVYEYYMYLGVEDALNNNMRSEEFFHTRSEVAEKCMDAYMFGFLMAGMA